MKNSVKIYLKEKLLLLILIFITIIFFFFIILKAHNKEKELRQKLNSKKENLKRINSLIKKTKDNISKLDYDPEFLKRIAREKHNLGEEEEIFIYQDD